MKKVIVETEEPYRISNCNKLLNARMKSTDDIEKFRDEVVKLVELVYPKFAKANKKQLACDFFVNGLPENIKKAVMSLSKNVKDVDDAVTIALLNKSFTPAYNNEKRFSEEKKHFLNKGTIKCFKCNNFGHIARNCSKESSKRTTSSVGFKKNGRCLTDVFLDGRKVEVLVDTGADITLLPSSVYKANIGDEKVFRMADGSSLTSSGRKITSIEIGGIIFEHECYIAGVKEPLLGWVFIKKHQIIIKPDGSLSMDKPLEVNVTSLVDELDEEASLDEVEFLNTVFAEELVPPIEQNLRNTHARKGPEMDELLKKWNKLFVGLGKTDLISHRIETGNAQPIRCPQYRVPTAYLDAAKENVHQMLVDGVIEKSMSEWCSPVIPVKKHDGGIRIAIDFRKMNEISKKDAYPMPSASELFDKLYGAKVFSKLDLRQGYYQIPLRTEDKEKTAFRFGGQLYQFTRMPFGLSSAPQTFVRMMNKLFAGVNFVDTYIDDCLIYSKNEEEHLAHLEKVFEILYAGGLTVKMEKCEFFKKEVSFLGFKISDGEIRPLEEKVKVINDFPRPKDWKETSRFLGMCGYYRNLIEDYGRIAGPLYALSKKGKKFVWDGICEDSFQKLKEKMASSPVVGMMDYNKKIIVKTDASNFGVGALLLNEDHLGVRNVIEYAGFSFNETQMRYPVIEKEATAIMYALERWQNYLLGREFVLETDHRPLMWLKSKKDVRGKLGKMSIRLSEFGGLTLKHIPGKHNEDADALSRMVNTLEDTHAINFQDLAKQQKDDNKLIEVREKLPNLFIQESGILYFSDSPTSKRLCLPQTEVQTVLKNLHDDNGNIGINRTIELVRERFYWPKLRQNVKNWINKCHQCAIKKDTIPGPPVALMISVEASIMEPFQRLAIDILEMPKSSAGNNQIVVVQDYFSKWVEAKPFCAGVTSPIIKWINDEIFCRFGIPSELVTDQGSQFESAEFKEFSKKLGIRQIFSTPYHHQANGMVERLHKTLLNMLRVHIDDSQKDWDEYLAGVLFAYRTSVHSVHGKSPFEVLQIRTPRMPMDTMYPTKVDEYACEKIMEKMTIVRSQVREKLKKSESQRKMKYDNNKNVKVVDFSIGQLVYWKKPFNKIGLSPKLGRKWTGPFRVTDKISDVNIRISGKNGNTTVVHVNYLKECRDNSLELVDILKRGRPKNAPNRGTIRSCRWSVEEMSPLNQSSADNRQSNLHKPDSSQFARVSIGMISKPVRVIKNHI